MQEETKVSKAQQKAVHKYVKNNYDRIELTVPKGKKSILQAHAQTKGESLNGFVNRALDETMERDNTNPAARLEYSHTAAVVTDLPKQEANSSSRVITPEAKQSIDLQRLAKDVKFQVDVGIAYGEETLTMLLNEARRTS